VDYDPFSSNAIEETLEDFADSMDEEEVVEITRTISYKVVVECGKWKVMTLMKLMTMPTTNLKTSIQCDWIQKDYMF
jgi:hypothetical protein